MTEPALGGLLARYREPHRHYHDERHLAEVLRGIDLLASHVGDLRTVRLAAWFHDAIYDPRRDDNEEQSARLAEAVLPPPLRRPVARLVRLTATHNPSPDDPDGTVLCDADLAVLGMSPERYSEYAHDVRREYAHLPDDVYRRGRVNVLRSIADRNRIYGTPVATTDAWEDQARTNIAGELNRLCGDATPLR